MRSKIKRSFFLIIIFFVAFLLDVISRHGGNNLKKAVSNGFLTDEAAADTYSTLSSGDTYSTAGSSATGGACGASGSCAATA